jgi:hypothetical protein
METRFDHFSPRACLAALSALALMILISLVLNPQPIKLAPADLPADAMTDPILYATVIKAVANGDNYYVAAAREHRRGGFPLKPFVTVRMPTLAVVSAKLGPSLIKLTMFALIGACVCAWYVRLRDQFEPEAIGYTALGVIAVSTIVMSLPTFLLFHEAWAAPLIALSLALRTPERYRASIIIGLLAVLVRELALPYLLLMGFVAACEKRWTEVLGWSIGVALAGVAIALHAQAVASVVLPADLGSQGWNGMAGWAFFVSAMSNVTLLILLPEWLARIAVPLSLFGWVAWKSDVSLRVTGLLLGYAALLMVFARPENFYWGVLIAPLVLVGLCFAPAGLVVLWTRSELPTRALSPI